MYVPALQFLNRMAVCFGLCLVVMILITLISPLAAPVEFRHNTTVELRSSKGVLAAGIVVIILTLALYVIFSPLVLAK